VNRAAGETKAQPNTSISRLGAFMALFLDERRTDQKGKACEDLHVAVDGESIGDIVEKNQKLILRYYDDVLTHAGKSFSLAWLSAIGAYLIFAVTLASVFGLKIWEIVTDYKNPTGLLPPSIAIGGLGAFSGAIVQVYSGVAFHLYHRAASQFGAFQACLERTHRYLVAYKIAEKLQGNKDQTLHDLVCAMANAPMILPAEIAAETPNQPKGQPLRKG
jgi:hypothetical protein